MIGRGFIVEDDLFGIVRRIKAVDPDYFILFDYAKRAFELHLRCDKGGTRQLVLPYPRLDERAFSFVMRTRRERAKALLAELERDNEALEKTRIESLTREAEKNFERAMAGREIL